MLPPLPASPSLRRVREMSGASPQQVRLLGRYGEIWGDLQEGRVHLRCAFWRLAESLGARCCRRRDAALVATRPRHVRAMSTAGAQCHRKWDATFITHVVAGEMRAEALQPSVE